MKNPFLYKSPTDEYTFEISPSSREKELESPGNVSKNIDENIEYARKLFSLPKNGDVLQREFTIRTPEREYKAYMMCVEGLSNSVYVNDFVLRPLMHLDRFSPDKSIGDLVEKTLVNYMQFSKNTDIDAVLLSVNIGNAALFVDELDYAFSLDVKTWEHRNVGNPENESVIQGPHEGFNEVLRCNTALIRKTLNTPNLVMENIPVGKTTRTPGAIAYLRNVANDSLVNEVRRRIEGIDAQYVFSSLDVEQYIEDASFMPVPQMITTERPDRVCRALSEGRVAFVMNGSSHALIMPATFFDLITSAEDEYLRYPYSLLIRVLRYLAVFLSLLFPAVFAAVLNYHPELLITNLLLAVSSSRVFVPFGALTELILMEVAFELIKEAGIRVPGPIGSTLGIVGGLIIGQAAVEANLVSPIMIIIVAITGIASFTIPSYSLSFSFRFTRFIYILAGAIGGLYALSVVFFINTAMVMGTKSFGVAFLSPLTPSDAKAGRSLLFGLPIWMRGTKREESLRPKDMYKKGRVSRVWRE